jgi:hypothetical protein
MTNREYRTEWMYEVEVCRTRSAPGGASAKEWRKRHVEEVERGEVVRCVHCKGEVRLHKGPKVRHHAEHKDAADAMKCPGSPLGKAGSRMPTRDS